MFIPSSGLQNSGIRFELRKAPGSMGFRGSVQNATFGMDVVKVRVSHNFHSLSFRIGWTSHWLRTGDAGTLVQNGTVWGSGPWALGPEQPGGLWAPLFWLSVPTVLCLGAHLQPTKPLALAWLLAYTI